MTGDLATPEGVAAAVDGVDVVVHLAGTAKGDEDKARHLMAAVKRTGTRHLVYISVVGADRVPVVSGVDRAMFGYFASKRGAERVVAESGVPWTTLWATQFHELMLTNVEKMARLPVSPGARPVPACGRRRGGGPARAARARRSRRPDRGHRGTEGVRDGRARARLPEGPRQAPADAADPPPRKGGARAPGGRQPGHRPGRRPADVGGLPGRSADRLARP